MVVEVCRFIFRFTIVDEDPLVDVEFLDIHHREQLQQLEAGQDYLSVALGDLSVVSKDLDLNMSKNLKKSKI